MSKGFKGEYNHSLDAKGRVIMPAKFREILGDEFVIARGLDHCLFVYSQTEWDNIENKIREMPTATEDGREFLRFLFAGASDCEIDKQGRVTIPTKYRKFAGLEKEVVLVGVLNRIEIWDAATWEEKEFGNVNAFAERMAEFGLIL